MKKLKPRLIFPALIIIVFLVTLGYFWVKSHPVVATKTTTDSDSSATNNDQAIVAPTPADLTNITMPIMMFHHIRDYVSASDTIGTNLSVSPAKFAIELDLIKSLGYTTTTFQDLESGKLPAKPIILTFDDGYDNFYTNAYPELKKRGMVAVSYIITNKINTGMYMTADQIKEISQNGIEIGAHTKSHPDLTTISLAKAQDEIDGSKTTLESIVGKPVISFCYPSGKLNSTIEKLVSDAGYKFATTTVNKISDFKDPLAIPRDRVNSDTNIAGYLK